MAKAALIEAPRQTEAPPQVVPMASPSLAASPMLALVERIMGDPSLPMERVNQAFDFYLRLQADTAKKAYDAALAAAQKQFPRVAKNRRVAFRSKSAGGADTDYMHEDLAELVEKCGPILNEHGISYKWRTKNAPNEPIVVTCVLTHELGYSEENTLCGPRDESGNKNSLQGIASTVTYLERYTFKAAIGVASAHDDDGRAAGAPAGADKAKPVERINADQVKKLCALVQKAPVPAETSQTILEHWKITDFAELTVEQYTATTKQLKDRLGVK